MDSTVAIYNPDVFSLSKLSHDDSIVSLAYAYNLFAACNKTNIERNNQMALCEYCWEECICAFVKMPPCNFCTTHSICDVCSELFCSELIDKTDEESKDIRCPECL